MLKKLIDFEAYYFPYLYVSAMPDNNVMLPGLSNFRYSTPFERLLAIKITNLCFKPKLSLLVIPSAYSVSSKTALLRSLDISLVIISPSPGEKRICFGG